MPKILQQWTVQPHGPLEDIDTGILTVTGEIVMPLGRFPRRMTVVALSGGRTAIWSAIALSEPDMARIEALGRPAVLIVPNPGHRLDSHIWKKRYPGTLVLAPAGATDAVAEATPVDATDGGVLDDPHVDFVTVDGSDARESALVIRRPDGTTLVTNDIIGHVRHPHGLGANVMARLFGYGVHRPAIPRTVRRFISDKRALAEQMRRWAGIPDLRRIIVSHGEPIEADPAGTLRRLADSID